MAFVQCALLYTSVAGQRRLRIHNLAFTTCSQLSELYRCCEMDTTVNYLSKYALRQVLSSNPSSIKEGLIQKCVQILACYRQHCATPSTAGQVIRVLRIIFVILSGNLVLMECKIFCYSLHFWRTLFLVEVIVWKVYEFAFKDYLCHTIAFCSFVDSLRYQIHKVFYLSKIIFFDIFTFIILMDPFSIEIYCVMSITVYDRVHLW